MAYGNLKMKVWTGNAVPPTNYIWVKTDENGEEWAYQYNPLINDWEINTGWSSHGEIQVEDNLNSTSTTTALSANQGRVLNEKMVAYDNNGNIILRPGTKIAGTPADGGTSHEILGINTYTDGSGEFDQFEVGSQEALYNINLLYDARTKGHATADIYQNGSPTKQVFAYISDIETFIANESAELETAWNSAIAAKISELQSSMQSKIDELSAKIDELES